MTAPLSARRMLAALRQMWKDEGVSQTDLATKVGVTQGRISDYLRGHPPKQDKVERFAEVFRIHSDFFSDPTIGESPDYRLYVGRRSSTRDAGRGAPEVEAFIAEHERKGSPLPDAAVGELRGLFNGGSRPSRMLVEVAYGEWAKAQVGRVPDRPSLNLPIDEARGQRALPETKKKPRR